MQISSFRSLIKHGWLLLGLILAQPAWLWAQETSFAAALKTASVEPVPVSFVNEQRSIGLVGLAPLQV